MSAQDNKTVPEAQTHATDPAPRNTPDRTTSSAQDIARRAERLQRTRAQPPARPLRGLGAFGVIGWSVAVPTVAGALLGLWLENIYPQRFSWPIALILGGLVIGIMVAWDWIARQQREEEALAKTATHAPAKNLTTKSGQKRADTTPASRPAARSSVDQPPQGPKS